MPDSKGAVLPTSTNQERLLVAIVVMSIIGFIVGIVLLGVYIPGSIQGTNESEGREELKSDEHRTYQI